MNLHETTNEVSSPRRYESRPIIELLNVSTPFSWLCSKPQSSKVEFNLNPSAVAETEQSLLENKANFSEVLLNADIE